MFFKKKKPKIDPKIRFQNRQFNQKLQEARTYKRSARSIPESSFRKFLSQVGLGSIWRQLLFLIIFGGAVYIVYIPNFLTTQKIIIEGMSASDTAAAETAIQDSLNGAKFWNPQHNILFLSKNRLAEAVNSIPGTDRINDINKDFKNKTVNISVTSKYERFLVRSTDKVYDVYNDGSTKGVAGIDKNSWENLENPSMVKVEISGRITNDTHKEFLTPDTVKYILDAEKQLKGVVGSSLAYIKISLPEFKQPLPPTENDQENSQQDAQSKEEEKPDAEKKSEEETASEPIIEPEPVNLTEVTLPIKADEIEFYMRKGNSDRYLRVIADTKESAHDLVQRLNLLLSQTAPERYNNLSYVDLRVANRAFICLINTPCNR